MRSTINIFNITRISVQNVREDIPCQHVTFSSEDGEVLDLTIFGETFLPTAIETANAACALAEETRQAIAKSHVARIATALKNADAVHRLDCGDVAPFRDFATLFCDLAKGDHASQWTRDMASDARRKLRAITDKLYEWEDANGAEISLANAIRNAFLLFEYRGARFETAYTAFWEGFGRASALTLT